MCDDNKFLKVVGIAWTTIYTINGIASWRVWTIGKEKKIDVKTPLRFYVITLFLNYLWVAIAFGLDWLLVAIIEMSILLVFVVITGLMFYRINKISGCTYIPYFIYLFYATVLCIHIYILNF
jgi:tryptophan-rich sensory protein